MSEHSPIQWCDGTVNPIMGCEGCELWQARTDKRTPRRSCYAGILHERGGGKKPGHALTFEEPTAFPGRMVKAARAKDLTGQRREDKPWLDGMPRLWFVSDMGDALSRGVSFEYLHAEIIDAATSPEGRRHIWLWLTKQPKRMAEFFLKQLGGKGWPPNLWPGTSITAPDSIERLHRIDDLRQIGDEHTTRFLSVEPQHELVSLTWRLEGVHWVIQGGESEARRTTPGTPEYEQYGARPFDLAWAREIRDECQAAGVPYFLKQLGTRAIEGGRTVTLKDRHGGDWDEWPADLRVREVPRSAPGVRAPDPASPREEPMRSLPVVTTAGSVPKFVAEADGPPTLWTIGYEGRSVAAMIATLREAGVERVVDVRQSVVSRWKPEFAKFNLDAALRDAGIDYVHVVEAGNPYRAEMKASHERGAKLYGKYLDAHPEVVDAVVAAVSSKRSALMCICGDAARCHRGVLIDRMRPEQPRMKVAHLLAPAPRS